MRRAMAACVPGKLMEMLSPGRQRASAGAEQPPYTRLDLSILDRFSRLDQGGKDDDRPSIPKGRRLS